MKLELTTNKLDKVEHIISIMVLGMIESILNGKMTIDEAERILFSPNIASNLEKIGMDDSIIRSIWLGTELEDVQSIIPEKLIESLLEIKDMILTNISSYKFDLSHYLIDEMNVNLNSLHYQIITPFPEDNNIILEN